jgi:hypothetical protein
VTDLAITTCADALVIAALHHAAISFVNSDGVRRAVRSHR